MEYESARKARPAWISRSQLFLARGTWQAFECCSEDSSRYILKGACLDVRESKLHYVVGTNGRCLFSANSFCFDLKKSVVIPDSKFLEWPDFMDEERSSLSMEPGEEAEQGTTVGHFQTGTEGNQKSP
jgi:hypothetical protein